MKLPSHPSFFFFVLAFSFFLIPFALYAQGLNLGCQSLLGCDSGGVTGVVVSVSPTPITVGQTATITWSSSNNLFPSWSPVFCTASGFAGNGFVSTSGSANDTPSSPGTYTYSVSCWSGANDMKTGSATLVVNPSSSPTNEPWVDMGCGVTNNYYNITCNPTQEQLDITCQPGEMLQGRSIYSCPIGVGWRPFRDERRCVASAACSVTPVSVSCTPSPTTAGINQNVTWSATASGGNGSYTYAWSGSDTLTGTGSSVIKSYTTPGTKTASVTVSSGGNQVSANCSSSVNILPGVPTNLSASCGAGSIATLSWSPPSGGSHSYYVRIQPTNTGSCPIGWQYMDWGFGPLCIPNPDVVFGTSIQYGALPNTSYTWWVHGRNADGTWGNEAYGSFTCSGVPDLSASLITPTSAVAGTPTDVGATVSNSGTGSTGSPFPNYLIVRNGANGTGSDVVAQNISTPALAAGATSPRLSINVTFPTGGTYSAILCTDFNTSWGSTISESNETNNCGPWTNITVSNLIPPTSPLPPLVADLVATPLTVRSGQSALLTWTSNADSCTGFGFNTQGAANNSVGVSTGPLTRAICPTGICSYQATCTRTIAKGEGKGNLAVKGTPAVLGTESVSDTVNIVVTTPTVDLVATPNRVNPGGTTQLSWTSTDATSCVGTGFSTGGAVSGTTTSPSITTQTTFRISCDGGTANDTVIVNVVPKFDEF